MVANSTMKSPARRWPAVVAVRTTVPPRLLSPDADAVPDPVEEVLQLRAAQAEVGEVALQLPEALVELVPQVPETGRELLGDERDQADDEGEPQRDGDHGCQPARQAPAGDPVGDRRRDRREQQRR